MIDDAWNDRRTVTHVDFRAVFPVILQVKKSKNDPNAPPNSRIPLPEAKEVDKVDRIISLRESAKRVKVDDAHPVSICFYTLLNAHRGCTAIDVSDDSSLLATGQSSIKV